MNSIKNFVFVQAAGQIPAQFSAVIEQTISGKVWQITVQKNGQDALACRELCKAEDEQALITLLLS